MASYVNKATDSLLPQEVIDKHMNSKLFQKFLTNQKPATRRSTPQLNKKPIKAISPFESPAKPILKEPKVEEKAVERAIIHHFEGKLELQRQSYEHRIEYLRTENLELLRSKDLQMDKLVRENSRLKEECSSLDFKLRTGGDIERKIRQLNNEKKAFENEINDLKSENASVKRQLENTKNELEIIKNNLSTSERNYKSKIYDFEMEIRSLKDQNSALDNQVYKLKHKVGNDMFSSNKGQKIQFMKEELARAHGRIEELEIQLTGKHNFRTAKQPPVEDIKATEVKGSERDMVRAKVGANNSSNMQNALHWTDKSPWI